MTRRWFFQAASAVGAAFGVKPAIATRTPAVKPKPGVVFNQSIVGHPGYVFSHLWVEILANDTLRVSIGYPDSPTLMTTLIPVSAKQTRWIGFSAVDGLDAAKPLRLTITGKQEFTVKSVDPHYRWPTNRPLIPEKEFWAAREKAMQEIAAAREKAMQEIAAACEKRADDWFISEELRP